MKIRTALSAAMLLLVAGCSSPAFYWYHPDRPLAEAEADYHECQDVARQKATDMLGSQHDDRLGPPADQEGPGARHDRDRSPGEAREVRRAWRERYEQSVLADGMRERGYLRLRPQLVPRDVRTKKLPHGAVAGQ
ncbi:MAG: hypothetical protein MUC88_25345 [Planctomycetes bacterium]|jgi:hypothetical protein|nr:hypothetical protein [Planctomycetota bacterium]